MSDYLRDDKVALFREIGLAQVASKGCTGHRCQVYRNGTTWRYFVRTMEGEVPTLVLCIDGEMRRQEDVVFPKSMNDWVL